MSSLKGEDRPLAGAMSRRNVVRYRQEDRETRTDQITVEEPMEIRIVAEKDGRRIRQSVGITMRTPGDDLNLAAGFLVSEGVIRQRQDVWKIEHCREGEDPMDDNIVDVHLAPTVEFDVEQLSRHVVMSSACGICGRSSIESVQEICADSPRGRFRIPPAQISKLPDDLERAQGVFGLTGGIHAAALFSATGDLLDLCEDVGRHNALDKVVGRLLMHGSLPAGDCVCLVSGRASFELVQKCLLAGIPLLAAVGAPSSLAVDLAAAFGMTLIGFLRQEGFNVYTGSDRVVRS